MSKSNQKSYDTSWVDKVALTAVQNKAKIMEKVQILQKSINKEKYDQAKNVASEKVREAQVRYEKFVALKTKDDPKVFWKYVQAKMKLK